MTSDKLTEFTKTIQSAIKLHKVCYEKINEMDKLHGDIVHAIELGTGGYKERARFATKLKDCMLERRYWKDHLEELQPIVDFFSDPANKKCLDGITQVVGRVRSKEAYHQARWYYPRSLDSEMREFFKEKNR